MEWPRTIKVRGIEFQVYSWEEVREVMQELGGESAVQAEREGAPVKAGPQPKDGLNHNDRTLLIAFVEAGPRGLLTSEIAPAVGKQGKGVRPALDRWARKIGLVQEDSANAFEPVKRFDGRGFQMVEHYRRTASAMLGRA